MTCSQCILFISVSWEWLSWEVRVTGNSGISTFTFSSRRHHHLTVRWRYCCDKKYKIEMMEDFKENEDEHEKAVECFQFCIDKVNRSLPLNIHPEQLEGKPYFQQLLNQLMQKFDENGLKKEKKTIAEACVSNVHQQRKSWLRQHIFYQCMNDMITDWELDHHTSSDKSKSHHRPCHSVYRDALHTAEISNYVNQTDDVTLLGLNKDDVISQLANPTKLKKYRNQFLSDLEEYIKCKCERVTRFHDSGDPGSKMLTARCSILPVLVENEGIKYQQERVNFLMERRNVDEQLADYHKALERTMLVFEDLLTRLKLTVLSEKDRIDCDWLLARSEALILKSKIIELQLSCELYNKQTSPALDSLNSNLDEAIVHHQDEVKQVELLLAAYQSVGPGFDDLVTDYSKLRDTLDDKIWAKRELAGNLHS